MHGLAGSEQFLGFPYASRQAATIDAGSCIWSAVSNRPIHLKSEFQNILEFLKK